MWIRTLGAAFMITGVTIGIGILGLPIQTGLAGFFPSVIMMLGIWLLMLATGWIIARNVIRSKNPNEDLGSIYSRSLGMPGKIITLIAYLFLLYGVLVAHLAAGGEILAVISQDSLPIPLFVLIFFAVATPLALLGAKKIEEASIVLLSLLVLLFFALTGETAVHMEPHRLVYHDWSFAMSAIPIITSALAYQIIVPTICRVLDKNKKAIKRALIIGTLIPVILNITWIAVVIGALPLTGNGDASIIAGFQKNEPAVLPLMLAYPHSSLKTFSFIFSLVALLFSYVLQATSMVSFFTDLLSPAFPRSARFFSKVLTFLPSVAIVLIYPDLFLSALDMVGGVCVMLLLGILPSIIGLKHALRTRHTWLKAAMFILCFIFSVFLMFELAQEFGLLKINPSVEYVPATPVR